MKRIIPILLVLSLGGCAVLGQLFQAATVGVNNPITKESLKTTEDSITVVFAGLNAYKKSCIQLLIPQSCRGTIAKIQVYTRKLPPLLTNLRSFVRNNDQVNAATVYNAIKQTILDFKAVATANNIQVQ